MASTEVVSTTSRDAFAGKTVLITGANGGLGIQLVDALVAAGAGRILAASRSPVSWPQAAVSGILLDVCNEQQIDAVATAHMRDVDVLINNAGLNHNSRFLNVDAENARREMEVNYFGTLEMIKHSRRQCATADRAPSSTLSAVGPMRPFPTWAPIARAKQRCTY